MNVKVYVKDISQMVWGVIWYISRLLLIVIDREVEINPEALKKGYTAIPYIKALEKGLVKNYLPGYIFQQDNTKIYITNVTQEWFKKHGVYIEDWPVYLPNLNLIEPVWRQLKVKLFELYPYLMYIGRSKEDWAYFKRCIVHVQEEILQAKIDGLILSIERRCRAVKKAKGYYTKY